MVSRADHNSKKKQYDELFALVAAVINEWDPYALLSAGAPRHEFDGEVAMVVAQVSRIKSAADAADVISRVFSSSFEPESFTSEASGRVSERLFAQLRTQGFVS
jgi:hypothetical protein